jgi:putative membrane protein
MTLQKFARYLLTTSLLTGAATVATAKPAENTAAKKTGNTTLVDSKAGKLSDTDLTVLAHVHQGDMFEVNAGKLAMERASDQGVKSFGKMLVDDHSADAQLILSMVQKHGQTLPDLQPVTEEDRANVQVADDTMARLGGLHGRDFDVEFLRAQIAMHDKTLAKLDLDITKIKDNADLVSMLRGNRPVIVKHKDNAQTLLGALAGNEQQRRTSK